MSGFRPYCPTCGHTMWRTHSNTIDRFKCINNKCEVEQHPDDEEWTGDAYNSSEDEDFGFGRNDGPRDD